MRALFADFRSAGVIVGRRPCPLIATNRGLGVRGCATSGRATDSEPIGGTSRLALRGTDSEVALR